MKPLARVLRTALAAAAALTLASCNLLFLNLGYEDEAPTFEELSIAFDLSGNDPLWPRAQITIHDDSGVESVSCAVVNGLGETKSFTLTRADERARYKWSCSQDLGAFVSAGLNTLTFTATDAAGNVANKTSEQYMSAEATSNYLKGAIDFAKTPREASFWHVSGISGITYHFEDSGQVDTSPEYTLTNIDDGTGGGGDKLFRGQMAASSPGDVKAVFSVTINGQTVEMDLYLSE